MDIETETQRENEAFEAGVQAFVDFLRAEDSSDAEEEAHKVWREWSKSHRSMWVDAQVKARHRWRADA